MAFKSTTPRSASIGVGAILAPSGTLSELFEDGDAPNNAYRHERLGIVLTSKMKICCKCSSDRQQHHLCHHIEKYDGLYDENTCMFGCRKFRLGQSILGREMSRVVNRMPVNGRHCIRVPTSLVLKEMLIISAISLNITY